MLIRGPARAIIEGEKTLDVNQSKKIAVQERWLKAGSKGRIVW
ncbi:21497_t:CDS:2 [Rhizophagus irregularis]|nr:21497_t:CDS:2 [Rhizophagus irregularis]